MSFTFIVEPEHFILLNVSNLSPFIIKAIGDLNTLKASVISPQSYTNILQEVYGIYIKVEEENDIIINSFKKYE